MTVIEQAERKPGVRPICRLVEPDLICGVGFVAAQRAALAEDTYLTGARLAEIEADLPAYIEQLRRQREPDGGDEGRVPQATFWLVVDDKYGGLINIRSMLTPRLREIGGHIGYEIAPGKRGFGFGTTLLALGLGEARALGLARVLLTCDEDNIPSRRVIEANGGICEGRFRVADWAKPILRYWIHLN